MARVYRCGGEWNTDIIICPKKKVILVVEKWTNLVFYAVKVDTENSILIMDRDKNIWKTNFKVSFSEDTLVFNILSLFYVLQSMPDEPKRAGYSKPLRAYEVFHHNMESFVHHGGFSIYKQARKHYEEYINKIEEVGTLMSGVEEVNYFENSYIPLEQLFGLNSFALNT